MVSRRAFIGIVGAGTAGVALAAVGSFHSELRWQIDPPKDDVKKSSDAPEVTDTLPTGEVVSNGTTWKQTLAEDFGTDAAVGDFFTAYPGMSAYESGTDTSGQGTYAPDRVLSASDSLMRYHLRSEGGVPLVAAVLPDNYRPHQYGRVQLRYRADSIEGYKFVGLFWPSSNDWNDGEIDWPEADLTGKPRPASAVPGSRSFWTRNMKFLPLTEHFAKTDTTEFHIATTEWTKDAIRFYWDDDLVAEITDGIPTKPMRVTLQAETWINQGPPPADASGYLEIDWIAIYEPKA